MRSWRILPAVVITALFVAGACSSAATPAPTAAPTPGPSAAPTETATLPPTGAPSETATAAPSEAPTPTPAPTAVASVPDGQLDFPGKLQICSDIPYPPQEYFDDQGNPIGSDIEIGQEIAKRLGLQPVIVNSVFDTIIEAVNGGKCDIIISAQNITADRLKQVDMVPYFNAGQSFVVVAGNPLGIKTEIDLCGKKIAAESGTTEVDYLQGTGDYKTSGGLPKKCSDAGKPAPIAKIYKKDSDAFLALSSGQVDSYFADAPVAGFYVKQHGDQFQLSGINVNPIMEGISVPKDRTGLRDAVKAALLSMISDGSYKAILDKYNVGEGAVTAGDVNK
jgi:polar amino acid transport system substrate-binding protein